MERCDICFEQHNIADSPAPFYRELTGPNGGKARKWLCLYHETARRRLVVYRQREARAIDRSARLTLDPATNRTVAHEIQ